METIINYHNKIFRAESNTENGEVENSTLFHYRQKNNIIWATYQGKNIRFGTLTGIILDNGYLKFSYQHINIDNEIMTGKCISVPEILPNKKIRLHETWEWTCKDFSKGQSSIVEID